MDSNHRPVVYKTTALPTELYSLLSDYLPRDDRRSSFAGALASHDCIRLVQKYNFLYSIRMNEFVGKKIGEVLAFATVSNDTLEQGSVALIKALGEEKVAEMREKNNLTIATLTHIATDGGVHAITETKAHATHEKLIAMRDLYVHGQWDNATELMEWSGFFEGAAVVHWALVHGIGDALDNETLIEFAQEEIAWHYELIDFAESYLEEIGQDRAVSEQ